MKQLDLFQPPAIRTTADPATTEPSGLRWLLNVSKQQSAAFIERMSFPATVGAPVGISGKTEKQLMAAGCVGLWCGADDYARAVTVRGRNSQDFRSVHCALGYNPM